MVEGIDAEYVVERGVSPRQRLRFSEPDVGAISQSSSGDLYHLWSYIEAGEIQLRVLGGKRAEEKARATTNI
jgi:hypothetical protein